MIFHSPICFVPLLVVSGSSAAQVAWHSLDVRSGHAVATDLGQRTLVLFGGERGSALLDDTWTQDRTGKWRRLEPSRSPPARRGHAMDFHIDPGNTTPRVVLFGGTTVQGYSNDTWLWDGRNWQLASVTTQPPPRTDHSMAFDSSRRVIVMFGGKGQAGDLDDHWEYDGATWTERRPSPRPTARSGHRMAYDRNGNRVVLSSGELLNGDTWEYDGATNSWKMTNASGNLARTRHGMAWDDASREVVAFAGHDGSARDDTQVYDSSVATWNEPQPRPRPSSRWGHTLGYLPHDTRPRIVLVGGETDLLQPIRPAMDGIWMWRDRTWTRESPEPRFGAVIAYDVERQQICMFGGMSCTGRFSCNQLGDTWTFKDGSWRKESPSTVPGAGWWHGAYDSHRKRLVIVHGRTDTSIDRAASNPTAETWEWDGSDWLRFRDAPADYGGAMAYDPVRRESLVFSHRSSSPQRHATWTWNGQRWTPKTPATNPPLRSNSAIAYDPVTQALVMFGGISSGNVLNDTWAWNGSDWKQLTPTSSPPARAHATLVTDPVRNRLVLFGGVDFKANEGQGRAYGDAWEWDGTTWHERQPAAGPYPRFLHGAAYDPSLAAVMVFGGREMDDQRAALGDTWFYSNLTPASVVAFGPGCAGGAGSLAALQVQSPAWIGNPFVVDVHNVQEALIPLAFLGFFKLSPPLHMWMFGPDCYVYATSDFIFYPPADYKLKTARLSLPIPNASVFVGHRLYTQAALVRLLPRIGLGYSDAIEARIGAK